MDSRLRNAAILFFVVAIGAWWARHTGWYNEYWFTDVILHLIAGAAFAYLYLWITRRERNSKWITALHIIAFATFGSVLWEFWEFAGWHIMPTHTRFYIPDLGDTLNDIFCGMTGSTMISLLELTRRQKVLK